MMTLILFVTDESLLYPGMSMQDVKITADPVTTGAGRFAGEGI